MQSIPFDYNADGTKAWLDSSCLPGVRALVARNGYCGKIVAIEQRRFGIDETRALRHPHKYYKLPTYIGQQLRVDYTEMVARNLLRQLAQHVQTLHEHHVVHLYLNPENIYVVEDLVQIQALRCMKAVTEGSTNKVDRRGACFYTAPEIAVDTAPLTLAADIWSLGVVLYYLLTGCHPFLGSTAYETMVNKRNAVFDYGILSPPSPSAQNLIAKMIQSEPRHRLTIQQVLEHEWMTALDETLAGYDLSLTKDFISDWNYLSYKSSVDASTAGTESELR